MLSKSKRRKIAKKSTKLGIAIGLALATMISYFVGDVYATDVSNIGDPTYHDEAGGYSTYNYVYFGKTANNSTLYDQPDTPTV